MFRILGWRPLRRGAEGECSPVSANQAISDRRPSTASGALGRAVLVGLGVFVPVVAFELALRLLGPVLPGEYQTTAFTSPSVVVGRQNSANRAGWVRTGEFTTWVRINSQGLRGPETSYQKPSDTYRILVLGDSFTLAVQVAEEQTFTRLLGEHLEQALAGQRFETINAGTDGWSTVNEYVWLTREGYQYEPDMVVLMFYVGNDPNINAQQIGSPEQLDRRLELGAAQSGAGRVRATLSDASAAYSFLEFGVLAKLAGAPTEGPTDPESPADQAFGLDDEWRARSWAISEAVLRRLKEFCDRQGIRLVMVGIPKDEQVRDLTLPGTPMLQVAERLGLPAVDLLHQFRAQPQEVRRRGNLYFVKNLHWTPEGHALAAQAVASELLERGLVPTERSVRTAGTSRPTQAVVPSEIPWRVPRGRLFADGAGVSSLVFDPAGARLLAGTRDGRLHLWTTSEGALIRSLNAHDGSVSTVAMSPDGRAAASGGHDHTIRLWNASDGSALGALNGHSEGISSLAFSPDGEILVSGSGDETIRFWSMPDGVSRRARNTKSGAVTSVAFSPDDQTVASGSGDATVRLWRASDARPLHDLEGHTAAISSLAFSPSGQLLASGSADATARLWRVSDGKLMATLEGHHSDVQAIAFSPDGQVLASGSSDGSIRLWRLPDGALATTLASHPGGVTSVAFSPDGALLASGSTDGAVTLWGSE